jgi:hypothetical protein
MRLFELAVATWVFGHVLDFDISYKAFLESVGGTLDLADPEHRNAMLVWLNKWGCRQFALAYHGEASDQIGAWYGERHGDLPTAERNLWELTGEELHAVTRAYDNLASRRASERIGTGGVRIGPTGAAKILFAARPRALPPWDDPIRRKLGFTGSPASYRAFLDDVRRCVDDLASECQRHGLRLDELPHRLGRPLSTVPKLVDEYYWVTLTRKCKLPDKATVQEWGRWAARSGLEP